MLPPLKIDVIHQQLLADQRDELADITIIESIDSTNSWAQQQIKQGRQVPFGCFAEAQSQGRGRRGRSWVSPAGANIYMSMVWSFQRQLHELSGLSLAIAVAVARCLERAGVEGSSLKWPNDVLVGGRKIAGILIETVSRPEQAACFVIGVGLNVHMPAADAGAIDTDWTDVMTVLGAEPSVDRSVLAGILLNECIDMCQRYQQQGSDLMTMLQAQYSHYHQQAVQLKLESGDELDGIALGLSDLGELRVLIDGQERVFSSAEVSLKQAGIC